jgi:hypothetical protein
MHTPPTAATIAVTTTWSFHDILCHFERAGKIPTPLTADEQALARRVAEAQYFCIFLTEMPGSSSWEEVAFPMWMGIARVLRRRQEGVAPDA